VPTWAIIVVAVGGAIFLLVDIGIVVNIIRERRTRAEFETHVSEVDRKLAAAAAADRGWERAGLEAAARAAWEARHPGEPVRDLELVEVIDEPGTAEDYAVFRVRGERGGAQLTLGRRDGNWVEHELRDEPA
jgi:hypothetical protein